ncbi:SigB/SigF/SigG family RNA polymerase sigma factor [Mycobacterium yunnanensis]|uniref:SigB/SigF/SigG family RNA polymerase sigma factor n=1 Tax=Mycobacterium yunnanensis TaxID=368477 RepID=A0A9X2Z3I4_9MYCO|nr:SigB/SigF/SigG family RNA polymerase sigma factor [Mycobacterium yunnanensis]MCV7421277.1 SigB/SigF/SigG family RNA polymerase sigma factor [Mycobacterium yunnanensis]
MPKGSLRRSPAKDDTRYDEVQELFVELRSMAIESDEYRRLRDHIIEQCLPLADHIARRYARRGEAHDDLVQVARVGLLNAVNRFDPSAGDFLGFAVPTVMGEVKRYFRDYSWSVKVPRRLKDVYPQLGQAMNDVAQRLGRSATPSELADELGMDRADIVEAMVAGAGFKTLSIDFGSGSDDDAPTLADRLGGLDPGIRFIEDREALRAQLSTLPERLQRIIVMRFFESLTQDEIAVRVGISQMHVSRLLAQALDRLRHGMSDTVGSRRSLAG